MKCEHCGATVRDDIPCCLRCAEERHDKARAVFLARPAMPVEEMDADEYRAHLREGGGDDEAST